MKVPGSHGIYNWSYGGPLCMEFPPQSWQPCKVEYLQKTTKNPPNNRWAPAIPVTRGLWCPSTYRGFKKKQLGAHLFQAMKIGGPQICKTTIFNDRRILGPSGFLPNRDQELGQHPSRLLLRCCMLQRQRTVKRNSSSTELGVRDLGETLYMVGKLKNMTPIRLPCMVYWKICINLPTLHWVLQ